MSTPLSLILLAVASVLFWLTARTLIRELRTRVPHLFFEPHPAFENRSGNRRHPYLWFTAAIRIFATLGLALMAFVALLFVLESLGALNR